MKQFSSLLENSLDSLTVNSNKDINTVNNSNTVSDDIKTFIDQYGTKPEGISATFI